MKRIVWLIPALLIPALAAAQTPGTIPNSHASDIAKAKVAARAHRTKHVRGEALGLDHRPVTPAQHADPATPATPAVPASPSHRPAHAGLGGQGRTNNPRRP